ncbi:MAG TPA: hypothetical protein VLT47_06335 [Anaeromyxobacteraceae bacterium]|nr:hypothetical protein [Anaeromyxobacteraceae bacterium]
MLRSPRLALAVLGFVAAWAGVGAWLPWAIPGGRPPPGWARSLGLDHPFASAPFLCAVALLFASLLACTWGKRARIVRVQRGDLPRAAVLLPARPGADAAAFLETRGFRRRGDLWVSRRAGLWGGWVLHLGLLALVAGVLVQQSLFDTGLFELTEGESVRLASSGALRWRQHGLLVRGGPPEVEATLHWFDPWASQEGYAPDRLSQLGVAATGAEPVTAFLDRSAGLRAGGLSFFHAIPTGFSVNVDVPGMGRRSVHLQAAGPRLAVAEVEDPAGRPARFVLSSERPLDDPLGTGAIRVELDEGGARRPLQRGAAFRFGDRDATLLSVARWGQYTYARAPGMAAVYAGFLLVLSGCLLLLVPAGVARRDGEGGSVRVFVSRGAAALLAEWERAPSGGGALPAPREVA